MKMSRQFARRFARNMKSHDPSMDLATLPSEHRYEDTIGILFVVRLACVVRLRLGD